MIHRWKVYLANCAYNRPYDDQSDIRIALEAQAKLYIQRLIIEGKLDLVVSFISRYENHENPDEVKREGIRSFFDYATDYVGKVRQGDIKQRTQAIMREGIKVKDALHLACALEAHCDYFITTDDGILKREIPNIIVCNPISFLAFLEEEANDA